VALREKAREQRTIKQKEEGWLTMESLETCVPVHVQLSIDTRHRHWHQHLKARKEKKRKREKLHGHMPQTRNTCMSANGEPLICMILTLHYMQCKVTCAGGEPLSDIVLLPEVHTLAPRSVGSYHSSLFYTILSPIERRIERSKKSKRYQFIRRNKRERERASCKMKMLYC